MVRKPPCQAEDMGSIPGQGTRIPHALELLSLELWSPSATTGEPELLEEDPMCCHQDPTQSNLKKKKECGLGNQTNLHLSPAS